MNTGEGNAGVASLASVLSGRMKELGRPPLVLDFGTIQSNWSLITNMFPVPIPKGSYMVCGAATSASKAIATSYADGGGISHNHTATIPGDTSLLQPGARVLVAWVQNDAVVIDVIRKS